MKDLITTADSISNKIYTIRGLAVMLDRDLAELYGVETKALNQAVKRNEAIFPQDFRFQLTAHEKDELVTYCDRLNSLKHSSVNPFGASLKDLGNKWFAFSKFEINALEILGRLKQ